MKKLLQEVALNEKIVLKEKQSLLNLHLNCVLCYCNFLAFRKGRSCLISVLQYLVLQVRYCQLCTMVSDLYCLFFLITCQFGENTFFIVKEGNLFPDTIT